MKKIGTGAVLRTYWKLRETELQSEDVIDLLFAGAEKCSFIIQYIPFTKGIIMTELNRMGCRKIKELDFANCVVVRLTKSQLKEVLALACVKTIEKDYGYRVLNCETSGIVEDPHTECYSQANCKKAIKLALFDTNVIDTLTRESVRFADEAWEDETNHGTLMAEIVWTHLFDYKKFKVEPHVYSAVVANHEGIAKTSAIMEALDWAIRNEIKIVSMSLGGYHRSALLEEMIDRAASYGIVMVAAAGNDGALEPIMYPAAYANVLSVGAKKGSFIAAYSNGGESADCYASGEQNVLDLCGYGICLTGTSGATAYVTGMILKKWSTHPEMTAADIVTQVREQMSFSAHEDFSVPRSIWNL